MPAPTILISDVGVALRPGPFVDRRYQLLFDTCLFPIQFRNLGLEVLQAVHCAGGYRRAGVLDDVEQVAALTTAQLTSVLAHVGDLKVNATFNNCTATIRKSLIKLTLVHRRSPWQRASQS